MNPDDVEISVLKLRVALLEKILLGVWVSELATTAARTKEDAKRLAADRVGEYADAIRQESQSAKGALTVFASHVEALKSLVQTLR
ncbi:MAG TPA: hypothetical protein VMD49_08230 [Steroidobacteraceae bacterium]|nr:hypothetical protein [Steroidobacteraceae bacterium]